MTSENGLTAADIAAVTGNNGGFGGWGDGSFWIIVLFLFALMGNGFGGGWNGGGTVPYINNDVQRGFDQSAVMNGIAGIGTAVSTGFANAEVSRCNGQMNVLQTLGNNQANMMQGFNTLGASLQGACCENRLAVAETKQLISMEAAATRANTDAKVQLVLDKLCQLEMDGIKQNYENRIASMQNTIDSLRLANNNARFDASQDNQTATIQAGQRNLANEIEQYVLPTARPAYIVANPNCCQQQNYGYGCVA